MKELDRQAILDLGKTIDDFLKVEQIYRGAIKEITTKLEILNEQYQVIHGHSLIHSLESRVKAPESIIEKLGRYGFNISLESARDNLTDIAGIRVVTCFIDDIYNLEELLLKQDDITLVTRKDYVETPKENGYRSLHLIVSVPVFLADRTEQVPVEIQLRTISMDFWASLEHQLRYKQVKFIPERINMELKHCAEIGGSLDKRMQRIHNELESIEDIEE